VKHDLFSETFIAYEFATKLVTQASLDSFQDVFDPSSIIPVLIKNKVFLMEEEVCHVSLGPFHTD